MKMQETSSVTVGGGFELGDGDALACVVEKVLGCRKYEELKRETASLPTKGMVNDRMVDEVFRILNKPLVKWTISFFR